MNPNLHSLQPYPFQKLNALKTGISAPENLSHISLSIGEPKHTPPEFVLEKLVSTLNTVNHYPITRGTKNLRVTLSKWLQQRYSLPSEAIDPESQVIPVNGTREALFAFAQAVVDKKKPNPTVLMPNPFYQIYEGGAILAGAKTHFLNCSKENEFTPDFNGVNEDTWKNCQLIYICSPGNPTGKVISEKDLVNLIELADKFDFVIASDECYSEIYQNESSPPIGLLAVCNKLGRNNFSRCIVFNSLSKRSNLPGLRSGLVAGDKNIIEKFLQYRTYHGCAMPEFNQFASIEAWNDEHHVAQNRSLYREKFIAVKQILNEEIELDIPEASFFLWLETPIPDTEFTQQLYKEKNVTVLPGSYLARKTESGNPGENFVRIALVPPIDDCIEAAERIKSFLKARK